MPVPDGTYTFRADGMSYTARVLRTADGYVTLRTADGCLEVRGGKLTLNVPLQPGVEATPQSCDAANTLQRWQLVPATGGYRLVNAITQMGVSVTDDGHRPTARRIAWQRQERTAFLHFGVNTFTGLERGTGDEDPNVFQPTGLDTDGVTVMATSCAPSPTRCAATAS